MVTAPTGPSGSSVDVSLLARIADTNARMLSVASLIPIFNWGFDENIHEKLRQRKHRLVNQQLTKGEKAAMSKGSKQKIARGLGGVCDTVGEVLEWMKTSVVASENKPTKMKTEGELRKEQQEKAAKAKERKKEENDKKVKEANEKTKKEKSQKTETVKNVNIEEENKTQTTDAQSSEEEEKMEVDEEEIDGKKEKRFSLGLKGVVDEDDSSDDEEEDSEGEENDKKDAAGPVSEEVRPKAFNAAAKKQKRKVENGGEATENKIPKLVPIDFSKLDPLEGRKVAMDRLKQKLELMKVNRLGKKSLEQAEEERKTKRRLSKMKLKQRRANVKKEGKENNITSESQMESEGLKTKNEEDGDEKNVGDDKIVYSKFDYILRDDPTKPSKKEKRNKFSGKDYNRLIEKAQKRKEHIDKLRSKNPEKAERLEKNIKWEKALSMAEGVKVKDNIELLKKGAKRKEKRKEKTKEKWNSRLKTVEKEKNKKLEKREANISKRKDDKQKKKLERLRKKGRNV